eukprot:gnl/TRDRNA2_/TRDRNA2_31693_c0_seq2.p1 gnl/TRDRNA2_/TRDRNA2_31693_c0~~gnl/TRDRNA2_/TRDRNA2_31693_c0_seq2.p1  ORF type:complete len:244 (+),score=17.02 gnl/TRDRNA2_/TRDRNA2_31693_c0_seq2:302-1033(+)
MHEAMLRSEGFRRVLSPTEPYLPSLDGYDVAIWIRHDFQALRCWTIELPSDLQRRCCVVDLQARYASLSRDVRIRIASVHLESDQPEKVGTTIREEQQSMLFPRLWSEEFPDGGIIDVTILAGDFNFCASNQLANRQISNDERILDVWQALRPSENGYTEDTSINRMMHQRQQGKQKQVRYDRVLLLKRNAHNRVALDDTLTCTPSQVALLGTKAVESDGDVWPSDHFGLHATFSLTLHVPKD